MILSISIQPPSPFFMHLSSGLYWQTLLFSKIIAAFSCSCLQPSIQFHSGAVPCRYGNLCAVMTMTVYVILNFPGHTGVGVCGAQEEADSGERGRVAAAAGARVTGAPLPAAASRQHCAARQQWSSQHCAAHILAQRGGVLLLWLQRLHGHRSCLPQ